MRRLFTAVGAALILAAAQAAPAQDFPSRPIRVVIAFPPGGPTDFVGRLVADRMTAELGQRVYIENRAGAAGAVGADNVAKSDADGYSLFFTTSGAVAIVPHIQASVPYDPLRDFAPIALVTKVTEVIVVTPQQGIKTARELVALAKAKPNTISFASTGIGSPPHLAQELLAVAAGVQFVHVPYRGAAPALTDLLGGQVQALTADLPVLLSQIQAGALVPIGVAADKRDPLLPDVPTLAEQGYANTDASNWYALLAPARTPPAIIARLNKAVNDALDDPAIHDKLVKAGAVPAGGTPAALGAFMASEYEKWGKVVKDRGIKDTGQ